MTEMRMSRIRSKVSLALRFMDAYTGRDPGDPTLRVSLLDLPVKPIRKSRGLYIYENLTCEIVRVDVRSMWYEPIELDIHLAELDASGVKYITLLPTSSYPYPPSATLLRATVMCDGKPIARAEAMAYALDPDCAVARVSEDVASSETQVTLVPLSGRMQPGVTLAVWDLKKGEVVERWTVTDVSEDGTVCTIASPVARKFPRGTPLIPVSLAYSGGTGELVLPFRGGRAATYTVHLQLSCGGTTMVREVEMVEGTTALLGSIQLEP